jgi:hypothetical protein
VGTDNRAVVEEYIAAGAANDMDRLARLRHPDWTETWPQSGERIVGHDAYRRIHEAYPGGFPDMTIERVVGSEDRWVATPAMTVLRISGSGDVWLSEGINRYRDGSTAHIVKRLEVRDGQIRREVTFFAAPFDPPEWRAGFVERVEVGDL